MGTTSEHSGSAELWFALKQLEDRISRIEEHVGLSPAQEENSRNSPDKTIARPSVATDEVLENQIGETLFARLAILVLAIGIAFLLTFPFQGVPAALPSLFGYLVVAGAWMLSYRWRTSLPRLSSYILAGTLVLLYFTTLRLFFFSADPPIENKVLELVLLLLAVSASAAVSVRRRSQYLAGISLGAGYATALIGEAPLFVFALCAVLSFAAAFFRRRYGWQAVLLFAAVATYLTHLIWAAGNPVMGNEVRLVAASPLSAAFVLLYVVLLAGGTLLRPAGTPEEGAIIAGSFINALSGYGVYFLLTIGAAGTALAGYQTAASFVFLLLSALFWHRERSRYSTFVYAMVGYMALSVAIIARFPSPDYFVWLACQSILVISTAVWFRSRFIIGANFVIYLLLFVAYLFLAGRVGLVSIIFGVVALSSARILNWQKDRLELRTDAMRDGYLASAFFIIPYALYHTVPAAYVSISWVLVAMFYYVMSVLLRNNRKYRWMALLTLCLTIGYVFLVDLVMLDPAFRIVSFLVLGLVLLWISVLYARKRTRAEQGEEIQSTAEVQPGIHEH